MDKKWIKLKSMIYASMSAVLSDIADDLNNDGAGCSYKALEAKLITLEQVYKVMTEMENEI